MKPTKLFLFLAVAVLLGACSTKQAPEAILKHTLENVERIKVAGYELEEKVKAPYEKDWSSIRHNKYVEQDNPQDTTIGASALHYDEDAIYTAYRRYESCLFSSRREANSCQRFLGCEELVTAVPHIPASLLQLCKKSDTIHAHNE